jgi:hypothetical protein
MTLTTQNTEFENSLAEIDTMRSAVSKLLQTKLYAQLGEAGLMAVMMKGKSLGLSIYDAVGSLYFVNGKIGMSTEMMASIIRSKGHSITKDAKSNNDICILHGRRADNGDTWTCAFSLGDAQKAGLVKSGQMYDKYPGIMLYNRAMSMLARQLFPDVIKGAGYTMDELKEIESNKPSFAPRFEADVEIKSETIPRITPEQAKELQVVLDMCSTSYVTKVMAALKEVHGVNTLSELPAHLYTKFLTGATKNATQITVEDPATQMAPQQQQE